VGGRWETNGLLAPFFCTLIMIETFLEKIIKTNEEEIIYLLFGYKLFKDKQVCIHCNVNMHLTSNKKIQDRFE